MKGHLHSSAYTTARFVYLRTLAGPTGPSEPLSKVPRFEMMITVMIYAVTQTR